MNDKAEKTEVSVAELLELKKAMGYLDTIMDNSMDVIVLTDSKGYILKVNRCFIELLGGKQDEVIGEHISKFGPKVSTTYTSTTGESVHIGDEFFEETMKMYERFVEKKKPINRQSYFVGKNDTLIPVEQNMSFFHDEKGNIVGALAIIRDITERRRADAQLRDSEEQARVLLNVPFDVMLLIDRNGTTLDFNKAYTERFNISADELKGSCCWNLFPPEVVKRRKKVVDTVFLKGKPVRAVDEREGRFLDSVTYPIFDTTGEVIKVAIFSRDITEMKLAEDALIESKAYLENIIESSLDSIVVANMQGYLTKVNSAFTQMTGFSRTEAIGRHMSEFAPLKEGTYESTTGEVVQINKEFSDGINSKMLAFHEKGAIKNAKSYLIRKDNKIVPVDDDMVYLLDKDGMRYGALAITRDITERKKAELKLLSYQQELKALASNLTLTEEKERRHLADYLHDEIGQHLFGIKIKLEMLKKSLSFTEDAKTLDNLVSNVKQVINCVRTLTIELSPPILHQLGLEKALEWLAEQAHNNYGILVTFEDDKREKPLDDDVKIFLYQAVRELFANVVKHAQTKTASVSVKKDNSKIRICVKDNGIGFVPPNKYSSNTKLEGFGLFSITERLEQLGGQIKIKSQPNCGTQVTLVAPLSRNV